MSEWINPVFFYFQLKKHSAFITNKNIKLLKAKKKKNVPSDLPFILKKINYNYKSIL